MKKALTIIFILFLFALGPFGLFNVLDTGVSLKYEVEHPRIMGHDSDDLAFLENKLNRRLYFFWTITVLGPVLGIGLTLSKIGLPKKPNA